MYDYIIVTHIPNFYKVNLYNELVKKLKILVVFTARNTNEKRASDFIALANTHFEYRLLYEGDFEDRDVKSNIKKLKVILKECQYKRILVSGWDTKEDWYSILMSKKSKNCLALESTINESSVNGIKGVMKKIFLSRISTIFASGTLHKNLLDRLSYKGNVKITKGVGIINKPKFDSLKRHYKKRFLFVGRLSKEKNIELLVEIFNGLKEFTLTIVGTGPLEEKLKDKAKENIIFEGQVANQELKEKFEKNDLLILPSISETWGLVVEEALYFGMPIIVSNNCGICELVEENVNGYVVDLKSPKIMKDIILNINEDIYQKLIEGVDTFSVNKKDIEQVLSYDT
tara:strand:+ start:150 stop:1178 length:1029 start_codon:yes stop_codon:yes gene_type:complete